MTSTNGVWLAASGRPNTTSQTSNSQYGQWFDPTRRPTSSSVSRRFNVTPSRQYDHAPLAVARSDAHISRDQLTPRDQSVMLSSPSCDVSDSRDASWRPATLPLSFQRSNTTLGRLASSASGVDSISAGQSHANLMRDYRRYRQLQAGITGEETAWPGTNKFLARPTAGSMAGGQPVSATSTSVQSTSTGSGATDQQQQQQRRTETVSTTVVPLQLGVAGPLPLQRSVGNVFSACRLPADVAVRRSQTPASRPSSSSSFANVDYNTSQHSDTNDITVQLNPVAQVAYMFHLMPFSLVSVLLPRDATQRAVMPTYVVVRLSVRNAEKNVVDNGTFMYAKHDKLVDADTSAPKPVQNTLNHVYRSFKVTHFGITEKPTRVYILLYNYVCLRVGNFEGKV